VTQTIDQYVLLAMVPLTFLSWLLAKRWSSRLKTTPKRGFLSLMSVSLILSVTMFGRMLELSTWGDGALTGSWLTDSALWKDAIRLDRPWLLNVGLFVPAGLTLTLTTQRVVRVIAGLAALSITIEFAQRWLMLGAADPADIIANCVGVAIGVTSASTITRVSGR
jgi:glycopeptide antibiotics resistance protein